MTTFIKSTIRFDKPNEAIKAMGTLAKLGYCYDILYSTVGITHQIVTLTDGRYCTYGSLPLHYQSITMQEFLIKHAEVNKPHAAIPKSALVHAIAEKEMAEAVDIKLIDPLHTKMKLPKVNKKKLSAATIFYTAVLIAIAVFIITLYIEWL